MSQIEKFNNRQKKAEELPKANRKALLKSTPKIDNSRFLPLTHKER